MPGMDVNAIKSDRTVFLTGEPVSLELESIIDDLKNDITVPVEVINETPEIKLGLSCVSSQVPTNMIKDRELLQNHVFDKISNLGSVILDKNGKEVLDHEGKPCYNGFVRKNKRLDIVLGLPGSGKSSSVVNLISYECSSKLIDNDEIKKELPEYNQGWGANVVHEESKEIELKVFNNAILEGENIVIPKIGGSYNELLKRYIYPASRLGYKINVHLVDVTRNIALSRVINRFIETGKFQSPDIINKYIDENGQNKILSTFQSLKESSFINGTSWWNNNVPRGEKPKLVECINLFDNFVLERGGSKNGYEKDNGSDAGRSEKIIRGQGMGRVLGSAINKGTGRDNETSRGDVTHESKTEILIHGRDNEAIYIRQPSGEVSKESILDKISSNQQKIISNENPSDLDNIKSSREEVLG